MIASLRRLHRLAALALLLAGLLHTAAAAQGAACPRAHGGEPPAPAFAAAGGMSAQGGAAVAMATHAVEPAHDPATPPAPDGAGMPTSSCTTPALPAARAAAPAASPSRHLSPTADQAAGHTVSRSHFRPPRPS